MKRQEVPGNPTKPVSEESATENEFSELEDKPVPVVPKQESPAPAPTESKLNTNFFERTRTTIYMLVGFVIVFSMGHFYAGLLVLLLVFGMFREVIKIKRRYQKENEIPITPILNWYMFAITVYYFIGKLLLVKMPSVVLQYQLLTDVLKYHNFITFILWIAAFLMFVLSLQKGYMKYQFRVFGWTSIATILITTPGMLLLFNLHEGLCWFVLPALLIISNDIFAYLVGYFFGKTKLIMLSPKKTWEGYIGGAVVTFFVSIMLTAIISEMPTMLCPQNHITFNPFDHPSCDSYLLAKVSLNFGLFKIPLTVIQIHALILATFASIIGPFGGFFASGLKRSIKIKDWGDSIPGHGGITDRMDCQIMMGFFVFFYLHNIVLESRSEFSIFLNNFSTLDQMKLYNELKVLLQHKGLPV